MIPSQLYDVLFTEADSKEIHGNEASTSFVSKARTFPHLLDMEFSDFLVNIEQYIRAIDSFVDEKSDKIIFRSEKQISGKRLIGR